eukprot:jgi/Chrzof1/13839/Cz08g14140.t1
MDQAPEQQAYQPPVPNPVPVGGAPGPAVDDNDSGTDTDEDGQLIQQAAKTFQKKQQEAKVKRAPKRPAGVVTLRALIDEGLITPAEDVITMEYKGTITHASLADDGRIAWKGKCVTTAWHLWRSACSPA